jgi:hypothetical protein
MAFTLYLLLLDTRKRTVRALDVPQRDVHFVFVVFYPSVVMYTYTNAEQSSLWVDLVQEIIILKMVIEVRVWTFEIEDKTFKICVAVRHQLDCLFFCLLIAALLYGHARRKHQF